MAFLVRKLAATKPANNWTSSGHHLDLTWTSVLDLILDVFNYPGEVIGKHPGDELGTFRKSLQHPLDNILMSLEGTKVTSI
jgi:hypothetical protein